MNKSEQTNPGNQAVQYELLITGEEARRGAIKLLSRNNKRIEVKIPPETSEGRVVKLTNALQLTDGRPGDILIVVKIKFVEPAASGFASGQVVEITDVTFDPEVLSSELPVVVDFWAAWCGPCKMMAPVIDKAAQTYKNKLKFCKINVDENPGKASQYQAMSIPMLLFFRKGQIIDRSVGAIPEQQLVAKLNSLL
jgi:thioredoxin 1